MNASYVHQKNNCNHRVERLVAQKLVLPKSGPEDHFWLPKMVLWTPLANIVVLVGLLLANEIGLGDNFWQSKVVCGTSLSCHNGPASLF